MSGDSAIHGLSSYDQHVIDDVIGLGYRSIFDIAAEARGAFVTKLSSLNGADAKSIHTLATSRVRALTQLYHAIQVRNAPILKGIRSLQTSALPETLSEALQRAINGAPDFSELFPPRSTLYAEAFSIQSLFSPGRYATELYKISKNLHKSSSPLNIDKRRPDIRLTVLNERSLTHAIPELEVLNGILIKGLELNNVTLNKVSYPWNLPYNDDLQTIRCVFSAIGLPMQRVWADLADYQWNMFNPIAYQDTDSPPDPSPNDSTPSPYAREQLELMPGAYKLLVSEPATEDMILDRYHVKRIDDLHPALMFSNRTDLTFNQIIDMTSQLNLEKDNFTKRLSRYYFYQKLTAAELTEYGLRYQSQGNLDGLLFVTPDVNDESIYMMSLNNPLAVDQLDRVERFIRLQRQAAVEYSQLDWLISSANRALSRPTSDYRVDTPVLNAIAEFCRLKASRGVSVDMFACFIGTMNCYARKYETSMFESVFVSPAARAAPPLNDSFSTVDFHPTTSDKNAALIAGGLGVSQNELYTMAQLAFDDSSKVTMGPLDYAKLYRQAFIPRMLGITFPVARTLWQLLDPDQDLAKLIARTQTLETLSIIRQTEAVLAWMTANQMDMVSAVSMVANVYSSEPTPDIFNFLSNIYSTMGNDSTAISYRAGKPMGDSVRDMLYRIIGGSFNLTPSVMSLLIIWQDMYFDDGTYGLDDFWAEINRVFSSGAPSAPETLNAPNLVRYSNALAQHAMISRWAGLTEQDLLLFIQTPERFFDSKDGKLEKAPPPSFPVLLMLRRLTAWQKRVKTTEAEAFTYFSVANQQGRTDVEALTLLAAIQGWKLETTLQMNEELVNAKIYHDFPRTFQQLNRLDTWMTMDQQLQCGSRCISQLHQMSLNNEDEDEAALLKSVADALLASTQSPLQLA
ncbi:Tc toxin subunit A [Burkholderia sp. S-53]|uniref:Tc toxin subunit A n=1 Tax=Burkholderia sp. S-53 TaxID=2906514 RepID=UPI0021CE01C4|nr:Tc toxin subunit A [Burkholderia sp. S-53]UXU86133.1 Tc toxin subunit A [Burkholderia sp. S-53]